MVLKIRLSRDGTQWMALVGENRQVGVAGFGHTVPEAIQSLGLCAVRHGRDLLEWATEED
jgi:hypothetical protein